MKKIICLWIIFFPIFSFAQLTGSEITFIKLTDKIGYVIDSSENQICKCITYLNKKEFRYAALTQFPDSHVVLRIKRVNSDSFTDVQMTEADVTLLYTSALNVHQDFSIVDTNAEKLVLTAISEGNKYNFMNYEELKFPNNLKEHGQSSTKNTRAYKSFKVGMGIGGGVTFNNNLSGFLFTFELAARIKDNMAIGFRYESMSPINFEHYVSHISSYTLNFQYYIGAVEFRPLVGIGFGSYSADYGSEKKIGFYPRVGFDMGHFSLSVDYNFIPDSTKKVYSYFGFRVGGFFGGGRK